MNCNCRLSEFLHFNRIIAIEKNYRELTINSNILDIVVLKVQQILSSSVFEIAAANLTELIIIENVFSYIEKRNI